MKEILFKLACCAVVLLGLNSDAVAQSFNHPGLLQSQEDLIRMKQAIASKTQPVYDGFKVFRDHPQSSYNYKMQGPMAMVGRNPTVGQTVYDADANAAYQNAVMWAVTGNHRYADKSKEIINAWSATLKSITGRDAILMAGLGPFKMVNAAELLRYTNAGWAPEEIKLTEQHFLTVIYPVIQDFASFANGNWDSAALKTMMAIGVFCNDRAMFEKALVYYQHGCGDGSLPHYIINEAGQCQESGRDQQHTQLGIAHLADCSEIAWHQGLDLYSIQNNQLLKGFEYTAKYNLGEDVPYVPTMDRTGHYLNPKLSDDGRGRLRAVWEEVYNHYVNCMGLAAPYTTRAAAKIRPELQGQPGGDHVGFGTFLYSRPKGSFDPGAATKSKPASPAGIIAIPSGKAIRLTWVPVIGASSYTVKRARAKGGFEVLKAAVQDTLFMDHTVAAGTRYTYTVSANNDAGSSSTAYPVTIIAGLPTGWQVAPRNAAFTQSTSYDGKVLTLEAGGKGFVDGREDVACVDKILDGDGALVVRYVPQFSSQFTGFGLIFKGSEDEKLALLFSKTSNEPGWNLRLLNAASGPDSLKSVQTSPSAKEPQIVYGRLNTPYWLKLQRKGDQFDGFYSQDGRIWVPVGSTNLKMPKQLYAGIIAYSGLSVTTTIKFDEISLTP